MAFRAALHQAGAAALSQLLQFPESSCQSDLKVRRRSGRLPHRAAQPIQIEQTAVREAAAARGCPTFGIVVNTRLI